MKILIYIIIATFFCSCSTIKKTDDSYHKWKGDNNIIFYD